MSLIAVTHLNDIGTIFELTILDCGVVFNISTATVLTIYFRRPGGVVITKTGVFTTDGTDGKLQYTTIAGDLDIVGNWDIQAEVTLPIGTWRSNIRYFDVNDNI